MAPCICRGSDFILISFSSVNVVWVEKTLTIKKTIERSRVAVTLALTRQNNEWGLKDTEGNIFTGNSS